MRRFIALLPLCLFSFGVARCVGDSTIITDASTDGTTSNDGPAPDVDKPDVVANDTGTTDATGDGNDGGLAPLTTVASVGIGYGFSCALRSTGKIFCWGTNSSGQLGNGLLTPSSTPVQVSVITTGARLSVGSFSVCAVLTDHTVQCWGDNGAGQLGQVLTTSHNATPAAVSGLTNVVEITSGHEHVCVRKSDASVWCWGSNGTDQLGHANTSDPACTGSIPCDYTPTQVAGLSGVDQIGAGLEHTCAHSGTQAFCWGDNQAAELGHVPGTNSDIQASTDYYNPTPIAASATGVAAVFAGGEVSCSINGSQVIGCWGGDSSGQLGDHGTAGQTATPVTVSGVANATFVTPGWLNSCGIGSFGAAYCWGDNSYGEQGIASADAGIQTAAIPTGLTSIVNIASNHPGAHHCALDGSGTVYCWGTNNYGECGHANTSDPSCGGQKCVKTPATVSGLP